jgi:tetratricopeptide (TPR) repeat protein
MRRFNLVGLCLLTVGLAAAASAQDQEESWVGKIVSIQGQVLAKRQGESQWQPAQLNDTYGAEDSLHVGPDGRAAIVLKNESLLRLDQNTTILFRAMEEEKTSLLELLKGAGYFFSRQPRSLKVITPFVNGVVKGTEFLVRVDADQTLISLFDGRILAENSKGSLLLAKGQSAVAGVDQTPRLEIIVYPRDAVRWTLYYPAILGFSVDDFAGTQDWQAKVRQSIQALEQNDLIQVFAAMEGLGPGIDDSRFFAYRAGLNLSVGRTDKAQADIEKVLTLDPENSQALALALRAIVAVVQNRKSDAETDAQQAVDLSPDSAAARIALSYAQQARFNLDAALEQALAATQKSPENAVAWARLSELHLCTGELDEALKAAKKAAQLNPKLAHSQTILGYAYLTQIKVDAAKQAFEQAIRLDSAAPLPRLGLGLAKIREGDLKEGRAEIEIAAGLDPDNSLMRSYLGKAYFDEKRRPLDEHQFEMAKALDPNDPTPWFYDAIRKQTENRPVEALQDLQKSIELNDNRAVYRSRLMLDEDLAARSASLGRIYSDLGFQELALREGYQTLNADPTNYSAHRLLADSYSSRPRHEIARVSELLQSQLMQPLNLTPVQPQMAESNLQTLEGSGPSAVGLNEYNPLFVRDRINLYASGVVGGFDTLGDEIILSGVEKRNSYSLGQYHYETEGFRDNNDIEQNIYNGFFQTELSSKASLQVEYRNKQSESGDLDLEFDPEVFGPFERRKFEHQNLRFGMNLAPSPNQTIIGSVLYTDFNDRLADSVFDSDIKITQEGQAYDGELQYLLRLRMASLISGLGYFARDRTMKLEFLPDRYSWDLDGQHRNGYLYLSTSFLNNIEMTCGLGYDSIDGPPLKEDQLSPKLGLVWSPDPAVTLRSAWFRTLKRPLVANQTVEPTQIAGFNQFFDDPDGTKTERFGIGLDTKPFTRLHSGMEFTWRDAQSPFYRLQVGGPIEIQKTNQKEQQHHAYLCWVLSRQWIVDLESWYERVTISSGFPDKIETYRIPLTLRYFEPHGFFAKLTETWVDQRITNRTAPDSGAESDQFWVMDISLGYRLPARRGLFTLSAMNALNTTFSYYDINHSPFEASDPAAENTAAQMAPQYWPEQLVLAQLALYF